MLDVYGTARSLFKFLLFLMSCPRRLGFRDHLLRRPQPSFHHSINHSRQSSIEKDHDAITPGNNNFAIMLQVSV